jgi:hypothetical protein
MVPTNVNPLIGRLSQSRVVESESCAEKSDRSCTDRIAESLEICGLRGLVHLASGLAVVVSELK